MHDISHYLTLIFDFFRDGIRQGFAHVNGALGILIALVAAYSLSQWNRLWTAAIGATVAHLLAVILIPVLANQGQFELPPNLLQLSYWKSALALFLGYLVVIAVFFFIKKNVLPSAQMKAKH